MLTKERKGEIALLLVKGKMRNAGIRLADVKREVHGPAKELGIPPEEAMEFFEGLIRELVDEAFPKKNSQGCR